MRHYNKSISKLTLYNLNFEFLKKCFAKFRVSRGKSKYTTCLFLVFLKPLPNKLKRASVVCVRFHSPLMVGLRLIRPTQRVWFSFDRLDADPLPHFGNLKPGGWQALCAEESRVEVMQSASRPLPGPQAGLNRSELQQPTSKALPTEA